MAINVVQEIESTIRKGEQAVLDAVKGWAQTVQDVTPQPLVRVPFADRLPTPKAVVSSAYDILEALLAGQRRFAEGVLEAASPLFPGTNGDTGHGDDAGHGDNTVHGDDRDETVPDTSEDAA
jgi:hypothetical protein